MTLAELRALCERTTDFPLYTPIPGYPQYAVDVAGYVWSLTKWRGRGARRLQQEPDHNGYYKVRLVVGGKRVKRFVHVLVGLAFHGPRPQGQETRHRDGNQRNNAPNNLLYGSAKDNAADREQHGRTACGNRNGAARLTPDVVREIRRSLYSSRETARRFGVGASTVRDVWRGKTWSHV